MSPVLKEALKEALTSLSNRVESLTSSCHDLLLDSSWKFDLGFPLSRHDSANTSYRSGFFCALRALWIDKWKRVS